MSKPKTAYKESQKLCDCGQPATVLRSSYRICAGCAAKQPKVRSSAITGAGYNTDYYVMGNHRTPRY